MVKCTGLSINGFVRIHAGVAHTPVRIQGVSIIPERKKVPLRFSLPLSFHPAPTITTDFFHIVPVLGLCVNRILWRGLQLQGFFCLKRVLRFIHVIPEFNSFYCQIVFYCGSAL